MKKSQETLNPEKFAIEGRYQRAQEIIQGYTTQNLVRNDTVFPNWIDGTDCFWYQRALKTGKEYRLVNARALTNEPAFDHTTLAVALGQILQQEVQGEDLPIRYVDITLSPLTICFTAFDRRWRFDNNKSCVEIASNIVPINETRSPDGRLIAFAREHNIWVRNLISGKELALTQDGKADYAYGADSTVWGIAHPIEQPSLWSPDSTRLLIVRRDKRQVKSLPIVNHVPQDGSIRPTLEQVKVAYPGDQHVETYQPLALDVTSGKACAADYPPVCSCFNEYSGFFNKVIWWAADSRRAYFIDQQRGDRVVRLVEFDTDTGATQVLFEEVSDTHINILPDVSGYHIHRVLSYSNELIWWSERSGWGHLYLYDLNTGGLKHAITEGNWRVRDILYVDEARRELWIQTSARISGRDPYYRDICRIHIDTGEIATLCSSDAEYVVHYQESVQVRVKKMGGQAGPQTNGISPNGNYFLTTRSRADQVPVTLLMDRDGQQLLELEVANISSLPAGWNWPEPVKLLAADGKADIYGLLFRPSDFSPDKRYPVLNYIVSSPLLSVVPKGSFHNSNYMKRHYYYGSALAELGFIVVLIDGCGTPLRSKTFQDKSYGWIPASANQQDHVSALQQLAARYSYMDMDKVGVFTNGYLSGLQSFLERQDIYKVCVTMSLMDYRMCVSTIEGDKLEGCDGPSDDRRYPEQLVDNLQGKLLLMHAMTSDMGAAYPPAAAFRVIDALQKANKNFDMLIVPNGEIMYTSYMLRRAWDYLVKHLQNREPPKEFSLHCKVLGE